MKSISKLNADLSTFEVGKWVVSFILPLMNRNYLLLMTVLPVFALLGFAAHHEGGEWHTLFDGKSLDGWTPSKENPNSYFVEEGVLKLKGGRSHLFYTGPVGGANFKNFELKLQAKTMPNSNSGVYFHTAYQDSGWPDKGFEAQVNTTHKDPKKTGSLYGIANIYVSQKPDEEPFIVKVDRMGSQIWREAPPSKDGEWFNYHIKVVDDNVILRVNGQITAQWTQPEGWNGTNASMRGRRISPGTIALQAHDPKSEVHYKNIRIKLLD